MGLLGPIAALAGIEIESVADRAKAAAIVYGLLGLFGTIAVVFLLVAAFLALAEAASPVLAALILAGIFILLALAVYLGAIVGKGQRKKERIERRRSSEAGAFMTTAALTAVPVILRAPLLAKLAIPAALLGAYAFLRGDKN